MWSEVAQLCPTLQPHRLYPTRFFHPWDSPGKNTGVGCHFLLQEIFPTQGSNPGLSHCRQKLYRLSHQGSSILIICTTSTMWWEWQFTSVSSSQNPTIIRKTLEESKLSESLQNSLISTPQNSSKFFKIIKNKENLRTLVAKLIGN